eukprot:TRINITY_DN8688_c0_g1_i1.p1 TRINITY_DN8688_c0_g1~~TRINITY_DN8688_c0_g1_i1.p1  ORF type:complete len:269 (-),score=76.22 TRINITY_DN8688_c0_g1_i1:34-840(-)
MRIASCFLVVACFSISTALAIPSPGSGDTKYYLTKSGSGYSRESRGLIPFPRTGRATNTWLVPVTEDHEDVEATPASSMIASSSLASVQDTTPDIMNHDQDDSSDSNKRIISKRSIPDSAYNRRLMRADPALQSYNRRLVRGDQAFARRLLRSADTYARRLLRSKDVYNRRLIRSDPSGSSASSFYRRLLRSNTPADAFKRRIFKKASLIPFPRTGKRSMDMPGEDEETVPVMQTMADFGPQPEDEINELMGLAEDNDMDDDTQLMIN